MKTRTAALAALMLSLAAAPAFAQYGGGMGGPGGGMGGGMGGGGRHGGGGRGGGGGRSGGSHGSHDAPAEAEKAPEQIEITGVIRDIDRAHDRVTIAYEPVEALNLDRGTQPFPVTKSGLLEARKVGDKVRFKLQSHQIYALEPF